MPTTLDERHLIENEMIFRRANEKISNELKELDAQLAKDDYRELAITDDLFLHFICECSDENCTTRIPLKLSVYQKIHKNRKAFIIKPTHLVKEIENVIRAEAEYSVVEKNKTVAEPDNTLNSTPIKNV